MTKRTQYPPMYPPMLHKESGLCPQPGTALDDDVLEKHLYYAYDAALIRLTSERESALAGESAALQRVAELEARVESVRELRDGAVDGRFHEAMRLVLRILEGMTP